jgi:aromatic-L-amino-acid/L-tryptophan decarboxylase
MACIEEQTKTPGVPKGAAKRAQLLFPGHKEHTLDPPDWESFRAQAHRMMDDILDYIKDIRERPVWQPIPDGVRARFRGALPVGPSSLAEIHQEFMNYVLPFAAGNVHPGFMGWVHGGGTPIGMLAEMLAAGLNANVGGRDHIPIEIERQVGRWMQAVFGFPDTAAGLFVTGTSMANFIAMVIARDATLGYEVRCEGLGEKSTRLRAYCSTAVHSCIGRALDLCGIGSDVLHLIPADNRFRLDLAMLEKAIQTDREAGFHPFLVVGTVGTVDTGAIDNLEGLADLAHREKLWFHIDGAYGALAKMAPDLASKLHGIERADSLAFDFHKWGQVPYDAGFILVRDGALQRNAFAASSAYLRREAGGLAAGEFWPCDYGPDLSRGFRALKTWFTLKFYGAAALGAAISRACSLARYLERRIQVTPELELLAPVELNIVCFRYRAEDSDQINARIVVELQESGSVVPSTTIVNGRLAIRAAIVNHRTGKEDIQRLVERTVAVGSRLNHGLASSTSLSVDGLEVSPRAKWEAELQDVDNQLASNPASIGLCCRRAFLLFELGRLADAQNQYIKVLERKPDHLPALHNLGNVLVASGHTKAARIVYREAVTKHPDDPVSRVSFGNLLLSESEVLEVSGRLEEALQCKFEARGHYEHALRLRPGFPQAHEGLSYLLKYDGEEQEAAWHRREAFRDRSVIPVLYRGKGAPVALLLLVSTTGGNVRLQGFVDDRIFQLFIVCPEFYDLKVPLPPHQLVVNGIGDPEMSPAALDAARSLLGLTAAPVINPPAAVLATSRRENAKRLSGLPGVVTPNTALVTREQISDSDGATTLARLGFEFPMLLRAPGFHTGMHFVRVENAAALPEALEALPGQEFIAMQYLDARGPDGKTRKYRAMTINGEIYPLHLAISSHWKIHYFSAEMADNPAHRAEDSAFLDDMPNVVGPIAMTALRQIQATLNLDYGGIDFGLNHRGEVLLFEANATMAVNRPAPDERWSYRLPAYERIQVAVQKMLIEKAGLCEKQDTATAL